MPGSKNITKGTVAVDQGVRAEWLKRKGGGQVVLGFGEFGLDPKIEKVKVLLLECVFFF